MEPVSVDDVRALRRLHRYFTRRAGALDEHCPGRERPLGEARLLLEVGHGTSLRDLRSRLGLDAGYLSRMIKTLQAQGLIRVSVHRKDSRLRVAELTPAGRAEVAEQNRRADGLAAGLLRGLSEAQRGELTAAVAVTERLLRLAGTAVEVVDGASRDARTCLAAYAADIGGRFPDGFDPAVPVRPGEMPERAVAFVVAYEEGQPVGCGALRRLERGVGEIRHMWVHPDARRLGLARRMLKELERQAVARGLDTVRLDTHAVLTEAQAMCRACGYTEIPPYDDNVHAAHRFEKRLRRTPARRPSG
ncbi:GNAT family N-acetyltransferase [Streptomyces sp. NPDC005551]|uniref:bifunctional helix-turn-helix transcriptional regulator/GNAT family N-acetyltransferase n=1 Tax=Streptomyces sp. NPDC005551 TaxID=3364725 RepID=UPI0036791F5E